NDDTSQRRRECHTLILVFSASLRLCVFAIPEPVKPPRALPVQLRFAALTLVLIVQMRRVGHCFRPRMRFPDCAPVLLSSARALPTTPAPALRRSGPGRN